MWLACAPAYSVYNDDIVEIHFQTNEARQNGPLAMFPPFLLLLPPYQ